MRRSGTLNKSALINEYSEIICRALDGDEIIASSEYDISFDGRDCLGLFVVTRKKICLIENSKILLVENISSLQKVCCGEYTGSGILESFSNKERKLLVRFSLRYIENFYTISEIINELINGNVPLLNEKTLSQNKVCPKCGRPFISNTEVCRFCTGKLSMLKRLWSIAKPCRPLYVILFILFWVSSFITILSPSLTKQLINSVLTNSETKNTGTLVLIVSLLLGCAVITWIVTATRNVISSKASNLLVFDLRNYIYRKIQRMPLGYIEKKKTGDLIQRINSDTHRIQVFIQDIAIVAVNELILFIAVAVITFYLNYKMALLIFVPMPLAVFLIVKIRHSIRTRYMNQWHKMDVLTNRLTEVINSIRLVKVLGKEDEEIQRFNNTAATVRNITCKNEKYVYTIFPLIRFIMSFGSFLVLLCGGNEVLNGNMSLGELVQFSSYGSFLYSKLEWFSMLPRHFTTALVSSQRVFEVLDETDEDNSKSHYHISDINHSLAFANVSFGYKSYRKILRNLNAHIMKGEMIGVVGHSGAGKSTFINLIMKLYSPDSGEIQLDGKSLDTYFETEYKNLLGVVLQESYLFNGTILDNILYANPNASYEDCIIAAKKADAHDFIMSLPDSYNTYIGEKGIKLSGGERQRISIARAIISNPKILILDEATSSVDVDAEARIQDALKNASEGKTVIAIAHRLSTLKNADRLFVFEEGKIVEEGTHSELVKKNGVYAELLKAQQEMTMRIQDNVDTEENNSECDNLLAYGEEFSYGKD